MRSIEQADAIFARADREGRALTRQERDTVRSLIEEAGLANNIAKIGRVLEFDVEGTVAAGGPLSSALAASGFDRRSHPSVEVARLSPRRSSRCCY